MGTTLAIYMAGGGGAVVAVVAVGVMVAGVAAAGADHLKWIKLNDY